MLIQFVVKGQPVGKGRPRFAKRGSFVHTYTPDKTKAYEDSVRLAYRSVVNRECGFMSGVPIHVSIRLYYKIPRRTSKKKREQMLEGEIRPCVKPDLDNCAKAVLDALNGIAFADDNQVCELYLGKWYDEEPRAEIAISDDL